MNRRMLALLGLCFLVGVAVQPVAGEPKHEPSLTPAEALTRLKAGNQRYVDGQLAPKDYAAQRKAQVKAQHPYAIILGCADSRVPPTTIFDESLGQLFEVRVAGGISEDQTDASIEYAAEHLHVPVVVVLGHDSCGAVQFALSGAKAPSVHLANLARHIQPGLKRALKLQGKARVATAVEDVVRLQARELLQDSKVLAELVKAGKLKIVGAIYHLDTGKVEWLKL